SGPACAAPSQCGARAASGRRDWPTTRSSRRQQRGRRRTSHRLRAARPATAAGWGHRAARTHQRPPGRHAPAALPAGQPPPCPGQRPGRGNRPARQRLMIRSYVTWYIPTGDLAMPRSSQCMPVRMRQRGVCAIWSQVRWGRSGGGAAKRFFAHPGAMSHPHGSQDAGPHHDHDHGHEHSGPGPVARLRHVLRPHSHETAGQVDAVMEASAEGMRVLWISLGVLGVTALAQAAVTVVSGSVALLGDTLHNAADALTAVPLGVAFILGRRPPTLPPAPPASSFLRAPPPPPRRYTYGYGRAEDLAGIAIVATIAASSALAAYEAITRLMHPRHISDLIAVAAAALIGFAGNEMAAKYRIRTGRKIGSAALIA